MKKTTIITIVIMSVLAIGALIAWSLSDDEGNSLPNITIDSPEQIIISKDDEFYMMSRSATNDSYVSIDEIGGFSEISIRQSSIGYFSDPVYKIKIQNTYTNELIYITRLDGEDEYTYGDYAAIGVVSLEEGTYEVTFILEGDDSHSTVFKLAEYPMISQDALSGFIFFIFLVLLIPSVIFIRYKFYEAVHDHFHDKKYRH